MKLYVRLTLLFVVLGLVFAVFLLINRTSTPKSSIIADEKQKFVAALDKGRMEKDPVYALEALDKLRFLDYRIAVAYNRENKPDQAIALLTKLISDQEAENKGRIVRSRSYLAEADYYEALQASHILKQDNAGAEKARKLRDQMLVRAEAAKKRERTEEGKEIRGTGE